MKRFTHLAKIYGIYCYYNIHTSEVEGTNLLRDWLIEVLVWIDVTFNIQDGFYIELIHEL